MHAILLVSTELRRALADGALKHSRKQATHPETQRKVHYRVHTLKHCRQRTVQICPCAAQSTLGTPARFYELLLAGLWPSARPSDLPAQHDAAAWPALRRTFAERFRAQPREAWEQVRQPGDLDLVTTNLLA